MGRDLPDAAGLGLVTVNGRNGTRIGRPSAICCRSLIGTKCRRAAIGREAPDDTDDSTYSNYQEKVT